MKTRGSFITFEGIDGSGKSTQLSGIANYLEKQGKEVLKLREPGGTSIGEQIRAILLSRGNMAMSIETELMLFAAARAQLVREVIEPALANGVWVLCDRFMDSTTAYQGYGRQIDLQLIGRLNAIAVGRCKPDLTLLFDLSVEAASTRLAARSDKSDRLDLESKAFAERTRNGYHELAKAEPNRFRVIDAERSVEDIEQQIENILREGTGI
ncbi:MAG: dTMP kinase [Clostridiaceae bacterium]|nr:dTMP kinase [Clostridiaceae bacterium]